MITYTIKYKKKGQWFWRSIKNVVGDGMESDYRFFHLLNDTLRFIPSHETEFDFAEDRQKAIEKKMSKEAGIQVQRD